MVLEMLASLRRPLLTVAAGIAIGAAALFAMPAQSGPVETAYQVDAQPQTVATTERADDGSSRLIRYNPKTPPPSSTPGPIVEPLRSITWN